MAAPIFCMAAISTVAGLESKQSRVETEGTANVPGNVT
ncbi:hypothetical protein B4121_2177 [Bacillus paralicheniformis]|uniref:Uncharacterized protein n=1 Tax=Bacillus paralicheniformis TaxID=1648923 RepID=A0A7Z0WY08_9BACI|nr:hypothetical protein B4121_2177 [Bacillus paralicheniformis]